MADTKPTTSSPEDEIFSALAFADIDAKLAAALDICDLPADATPAQKWEALCTLAICDKRVIADLNKCSGFVAAELEKGRRQFVRDRRKAAPVVAKAKPAQRPLSNEPKHTKQQLMALSRAFDRFPTADYPHQEDAVIAFIRTHVDKTFTRLTVNGQTLAPASILKLIRRGEALRAPGGLRRSCPEIIDALAHLKMTSWDKRALRREFRALARLDPTNSVGRRRICELSYRAILRQRAMAGAIRIAQATAI